MVDVTLEAGGPDDPSLVLLRGPGWELNIWAPLPELLWLRGIRDANPATQRMLAIGTCAGSQVYWSTNGRTALVVLGGDGTGSWDITMTVPLSVVDRLAAMAGSHLAPPPGHPPVPPPGAPTPGQFGPPAPGRFGPPQAGPGGPPMPPQPGPHTAYPPAPSYPPPGPPAAYPPIPGYPPPG